MRLEIFPIEGLPEIGRGDDIAGMICDAVELQQHDVVMVTQKIISKAEGAMVDIDPNDPLSHKPIVERESVRILRRRGELIISETKHGFVCANAGVDLSNSPGEEIAVLLPVDPDASARRLHDGLSRGTAHTPVVVTDTFGRPWREGLVDVALGSAGLAPIRDDRGSLDRDGRELVVTRPAVADQLAAAAGLLMLKSAGVPAVIVEGFPFEGDGDVRELLRDPSTDLFA